MGVVKRVIFLVFVIGVLIWPGRVLAERDTLMIKWLWEDHAKVVKELVRCWAEGAPESVCGEKLGKLVYIETALLQYDISIDNPGLVIPFLKISGEEVNVNKVIYKIILHYFEIINGWEPSSGFKYDYKGAIRGEM